jgi:hypothetical protein
MSEKIYACLLRLFPSYFREAYGDEALQLFRDRAHEEKGFFPRVRLWLDLLADLASRSHASTAMSGQRSPAPRSSSVWRARLSFLFS